MISAGKKIAKVAAVAAMAVGALLASGAPSQASAMPGTTVLSDGGWGGHGYGYRDYGYRGHGYGYGHGGW